MSYHDRMRQRVEAFKADLRSGRAPAAGAVPERAKKVRTHCKRGHAYTAENTRVSSKGYRMCRTCVRLEEKESRLRRKYEHLSYDEAEAIIANWRRSQEQTA